MKHLENEVVSVYFNDSEAMHSSISRLSNQIKNNPFILEPVEDTNDDLKNLLSAEGFQVYPTVKKTTLFYDPSTDCFFKILHPLNLKNKFFFLITDKSKSVYNISEKILANGVRAVKLLAYGSFRKGRRPFFAMKRAEGESLYDMLIRRKENITMAEYRKVIDEIAKLHSLGYCLGDTHLSHVFIKDGKVSGIIDIDGIRKNHPFMLKKLVKDIAGFNHPELPLKEEDKESLVKYYLEIQNVKNEKKFLRMLRYYMERRWKD